MNKVLIEITEDGWILEANVDGNKFYEKGVMNENGATHVGDNIDDMHWMDENLYDAFNSFFTFDVSQALRGGW